MHEQVHRLLGPRSSSPPGRRGSANSCRYDGSRPYSRRVKKVPGIWLLASAFAPLVALLATLKLHELRWLEWALLCVCALAEVLLYLSLRSLKLIQTDSIITTSVKRADERVLAFTSSYVVPVVMALFGGSDATRPAARWPWLRYSP